MIQHFRWNYSPLRVAACGLALAVASFGAFAKDPTSAGIDERSIRAEYESSRQACLTGQTQQSVPDCLHEALGAAQNARRGLLVTESTETLKRNALKRCDVHEGEERALCLRRVQGEGKSSGSVTAGGVLYEMKTIVPAESTEGQPKR